MAFTNETTHYGLPQWIGSDKPTYLVDQNNAYQKIDSEIYNANVAAGEAVTTANGASSTAGAASATAADALSAAQTASTTADSALAEAQTANTNAQAAQTAAGAAQSAAQAAQEAAAGNSITNLAPAYDPTIPYAIDALVTQDGKLYKCIVAVTTPEQFDINKWDDVTCSEAFTSGAEFYTKTECDAKYYTITDANAIYKIKSIDSIKQFAKDTTTTFSQYISTAITSLISTIQSTLETGDTAEITLMDFDGTRYVPTLPMFITPTTAFSVYQLFGITCGRYSGVLSNMYYSCVTKWDSTAEYQQVDIAPNGTVTYTDKSGTANNSDLTLHYRIYKR